MVYHRKIMDQQSAKLEVFGYIERFYNTPRTHSALGYKTPKQMGEMLHNIISVSYAFGCQAVSLILLFGFSGIVISTKPRANAGLDR